jgi:endonuclease G
MLIRVTDPFWEREKIPPDALVTSRLGDVVACWGNLDTLFALEGDPSVIAIEAGRPGFIECRESLKFVNAKNVHAAPFKEKGDNALVAIIDTGVDVLHKAFRDDSGQTRIVAFWDQTDKKTGPKPSAMSCLGKTFTPYGTEYTETNINNFISQSTSAPILDSHGHGTHVASIAAGRKAGKFYGGVAPNTKIVIVKAWVDPDDILRSGYSTSYVDALCYIKGIAEQENLPVVVNMSFGSNAGAHDGTSLLEIACDNFSGGGCEPGYVIVKSAGNEIGQDSHATINLPAHQQNHELLSWEVPNNPPDDKLVIELWWRRGHDLRFQLSTPTGSSQSGIVSRSNRNNSGRFLNDNDYDLSYTRYHYDNGADQLLITIEKGATAYIEPGSWSLYITSDPLNSEAEIQAWIERRSAARPAYFTNNITDSITLTVPGTARTVICVGAIDDATSSIFRYSSRGGTYDNREKPDLLAPGVDIVAALAGSAGEVKSDTGTSMAAPHVTGAIALLFSYWVKQKTKVAQWKQLNAAQIQAAIIQAANGYDGDWDRHEGHGFLDAEALLNAFRP